MSLYYMILVHLVYDFHLQGQFIGENKGKYFFIMIIHCLTWAMLMGAVLFYFDEFATWKLHFLYITHLIADSIKSDVPQTPEYFWTIYVDQGFHLATLIVVYLF